MYKAEQRTEIFFLRFVKVRINKKCNNESHVLLVIFSFIFIKFRLYFFDNNYNV